MNVLRNIIFILVFLAGYSLNAQFINSYTAEQGFQAALNYASQTDGLENPVLLGIGTQTQTIEVLGQNLDIGIDMGNGESNGWIYLFGDEGTANTSVAAVINIFGSYQATSPPAGTIDNLPFEPTIALPPSWIDSDIAVISVKADSDYNSFIQSNQQASVNTAALYMNEFDNGLEINEPYWITTFGDNDDLVCFTHAQNESTVCFDATTNVKDIADSFKIGPNPASTFVRIENNTTENIKSILIVNSSGNVVFQNNNELLDVSSISNGNYIILIKTDNNLYKKKLNIVN